MGPAISGPGWVDLQWRPDFGRIDVPWRKAKFLWHHADDRALVPVKKDFLAYNV